MALKTRAGWTEVEGALEREFRFRDFAEALAFVNRVGELAEAEDHHPDIAIHGNWVTPLVDAREERDHRCSICAERPA